MQNPGPRPYDSGPSTRVIHRTAHGSRSATICRTNRALKLQTPKLPSMWHFVTGPRTQLPGGRGARDKLQTPMAENRHKLPRILTGWPGARAAGWDANSKLRRSPPFFREACSSPSRTGRAGHSCFRTEMVDVQVPWSTESYPQLIWDRYILRDSEMLY